MMAAMKEIYRDFVQEHTRTYAEMFQHMLQTDRGATLIHFDPNAFRPVYEVYPEYLETALEEIE